MVVISQYKSRRKQNTDYAELLLLKQVAVGNGLQHCLAVQLPGFYVHSKAQHPVESRIQHHSVTQMGSPEVAGLLPKYTISVFSSENGNRPIFVLKALQSPCSLFGQPLHLSVIGKSNNSPRKWNCIEYCGRASHCDRVFSSGYMCCNEQTIFSFCGYILLSVGFQCSDSQLGADLSLGEKHLETFLVFSTWVKAARGIQWAEARDAVKHPTVHRTAPHNEIFPAQSVGTKTEKP